MITYLRKRIGSWLFGPEKDREHIALLERISKLEQLNHDLRQRLVNQISNASYYRKQYRILKGR